MSARVAYFERADRGARPVGVRLVGERTDERHRCAEGPPVPALGQAAAWLRESLPKRSGATRPVLDVLCVDVDGALCSWLTAPSAEPGVIGTLVRHGATGWAAEGDEGENAMTRPPDVLSGYAGMPGEAGVQALAAPPQSAKVNGTKAGAQAEAKLRLPVLAVPDGAARVLIDSLDEAGVRVESVCSFWHAMAAAWDPAGRASARALSSKAPDPDRVIAEDHPLSAAVLVDANSGRLLWVWSRRGGLIAAGSMRVRVDRSAEGEVVGARVRTRDTARLAAEWLAWSAQLAAAPSRLTCVTPDLRPEGSDELDAAGLGVALGRALPGATVNLAVDDDPVATTLRRLAAGATTAEEAGEPPALDASSALVDLSRRPGQAHFRLHLWAALAIAMGAACVGAMAWKMRTDAGALRDAARRTSAQARELYQGVQNLPAAFPGKEFDMVQAEVAKLEKDLSPVKPAEPTMPVLKELETLSLVLGLEDFELESIQLDSKSSAKVSVVAPSLKAGEQLYASLRAIGGSYLTDWSNYFYPPQADGRIKCTFTANWSAEARKAGEEAPR